ncbi:uncharacterized protein EI90DRAFT_2927460 [Cantharellus anzutake]|uniref:uncharacterized protein n=1 Tax=Cantharellus anzutake TaxID=1750568 RepID=UPI0019075BA7|nr:uncharacterized protein EI90DRAFT_2927460 [Cantharellus anzutake]KAF8327803.1 hypothetical protein EI90DRAFT_2927460 [Cantharellus anzutake]
MRTHFVLQEFESLLKEVVLSKRLSASKMAKLSEFSASHMDIDAQMVSAMYRTHKTLQSWQKLSSLYVFDALARTAKTLVTKGKLSPPSQQGKPNAASFLLKLEGVLEGLFRDLISITDFPEMKDKMKKVLDIWIKAGTFPTRTLDLLSQITLGTPMDQGAYLLPFVFPSTFPINAICIPRDS